MRLVLAVLLTLLLLPAAARAESWQASCVEGTDGPTCDFFTGVVDHVTDGDTLVVDLGDRVERVRITGVQAMEQTVHGRDPLLRRGECHALEATDRLEQLIAEAGGAVRVSAQDPNDHSGVRARRSVALWIGGQWVDVGSTVISEGLALFLPNGREWAWNGRYSVLAQQAAAAGAGIWSTESCAPGPPASLKVWVNANARGDDARHPEGEWVAIKNADPVAPIDLSGWWVRDSSLHRFTFTPGSIVAPGETVKVYVGPKDDGSLSFGVRKPLFENADTGGRARGDGAYVFDPDGDLRAWQQYPCRFACADPRAGAVRLRPLLRDGAVAIRNVAAVPVDLDGTRLVVRERDGELATERAHEVGPGAVLAPGGEIRLAVGPLRAAGDVVRLETYDKIRIACAGWGDERCAV
ncbi:MAG TPA: lamin tail domain-containing protein [Capillimicrobium sp.]|nr:lamin tail domain-containing protein [Capillimicrobium sp.]